MNGEATHGSLERLLSDIQGRLERIEATLTASSIELKLAPQSGREWLSTHEAAQALGLAVWTTRNYVRLGRIKGERKTTRRGQDREWRVSRNEIIHILEHGLRPPQYPV